MFRSIISSILLALMLFSQFYNSALWIKYEFNMEEITEIFCVNKEKPILMCNGKCYVKGEMLDIDIFPENQQAPLAKVSYLPTLKLFVNTIVVEINAELNAFLASNKSIYSTIWESTIPEPPFIPPKSVV